MNCQKCNSIVPEGMFFCPTCGIKVNADEEAVSGRGYLQIRIGRKYSFGGNKEFDKHNKPFALLGRTFVAEVDGISRLEIPSNPSAKLNLSVGTHNVYLYMHDLGPYKSNKCKTNLVVLIQSNQTAVLSITVPMTIYQPFKTLVEYQ